MRLALIMLLLLSATAAFAVDAVPGDPAATQGGEAEPDSVGGEKGWQWLGAPYITADSDFGAVFGGGLQVAYTPHVAMLFNGAASTSGLAGLTARGEVGTRGGLRAILRNSIWAFPVSLYPVHGPLPEPDVTALLQHTEIQWAFLYEIVGTDWEVGPEFWSDFAKGLRPEDGDGNPVDVRNYPRLRDGSLVLGGLRARYRTTSPVRPVDGMIFDAALRVGRADGVVWDEARTTVTADVWTAVAKPLHPRLRLYARVWTRLQSEAPPSVRNPLGGLFTLRGQPTMRDFGRRLVAGRFQLHWTAVENVRFIGRWLHAVIPAIPAWDLQFEVAPFADLGAVADPDIGGWRRTRQGYGLSLRLVLPPELVFFFDVAITPGGAPLYYFGGGEAL